MKTQIKLSSFWLLILSLCYFNTTFSQVGITWGDPIKPPSYGFDTSSKGTSALGQLEDIAGQSINLSNSNSNYQSGQLLKSVAPVLSFNQQLQGMVVTSIIGSLLDGLFSTNSNQSAIDAQKAAEAQKAAQLAQQQAAEAQRKADSTAQANYDKMMQTYKTLGTSDNVQIKSISDTNMSLKTLDDTTNNSNNQVSSNFFGIGGSAPLTQDEMEWQKIKNQGISTTWDPNSWPQPSAANQIVDETPNAEESVADKYLNDAINKIEKMQGGRVAALAGRFMLNIKKETMSYLADATNAITTNNVAKMEELSQPDYIHKLVTNALYNTGIQTGKAYYDQAKGKVSGMIDEQVKAANIAVVTQAGKGLGILNEQVTEADIASIEKSGEDFISRYKTLTKLSNFWSNKIPK